MIRRAEGVINRLDRAHDLDRIAEFDWHRLGCGVDDLDRHGLWDLRGKRTGRNEVYGANGEAKGGDQMATDRAEGLVTVLGGGIGLAVHAERRDVGRVDIGWVHGIGVLESTFLAGPAVELQTTEQIARRLLHAPCH